MTKRFYKDVSVEQLGDNFQVLCDNKPIRLGGDKILPIWSSVIANMIADEFKSQAEDIDLKSMPVTEFVVGLNNFNLDYKNKLLHDTINFINTDVLFYRASYPSSLIERQNRSWDPVLRWASNYFNVSFNTTNGILPIEQSANTLNVLSRFISSLSDLRFLCFFKFSSAYTSVILALSVINDFITAEEAFNFSRLEEDFQNEFWGKDHEAQMTRNNILKDILITDKILRTEKESS